MVDVIKLLTTARDIIGEDRRAKAEGVASVNGDLPEPGSTEIDDEALAEIKKLDRWLAEAERVLSRDL